MPLEQLEEARKGYLDAGLTSLFHHALFHWNIQLKCGACGHIAIIDGHQIWWHFHKRNWDDRMQEISRRCYCSACWRRTRKRVFNIAWEKTKDAVTVHWDWPDEREWKRQVRRYRS